MKKIVYVYNVENENVFIGAHVCQANPKRPGEFLFPPNYTEIEPEKIPQHKNAFFNVEKNKWEIKDDYRGSEIYNTITGQREYCITFHVPADYTLLPPGEHKMWNGSKWVDDSEKIKNATNAAAKAELIQIDMRSIRSLREWMAAQPDAPEILKRHEKDAKVEREKLK